jgi:hypothetical protein
MSHGCCSSALFRGATGERHGLCLRTGMLGLGLLLFVVSIGSLLTLDTRVHFSAPAAGRGVTSAWLDDQTLAMIVDEVLGRRVFDVSLRTKLGALMRGEERAGEEDEEEDDDVFEEEDEDNPASDIDDSALYSQARRRHPARD